MNNKIYGKYKTADGYLLALGTAIKQGRKDSGLSIEDVCKITGLGKDAVLSVETGHVGATTAVLLKVANAVGMEFCADTEELGRRVAALRVYRGMKQSDVEESGGFTRATLVRIEHGGNARVGSLLTACEVLDIAPTRILKGNL